MPCIRHLITTKRIALLTLCAVLGVMTSYAVAWWYVPWGRSTIKTTHPNPSLWIASYEGIGGMSTFVRSDNLLPREEIDQLLVTADDEALGEEWTPRLPPVGPLTLLVRSRQGLPFLCTSSRIYYVALPSKPVNFNVHAWEHVGSVQIENRHYSIAPLWPGLLANTAIYGSAWFVLLTGVPSAFRFVRTRRRRARGLCTKCSYDLAGLAPDTVCPECGSASR